MERQEMTVGGTELVSRRIWITCKMMIDRLKGDESGQKLLMSVGGKAEQCAYAQEPLGRCEQTAQCASMRPQESR